MHLALLLAIIVNIASIIILAIGLFHNFEQPKSKAVYGYSIAGCFISYIIMLSLVGIYGLIRTHNFYSLILLLCVISPFIIGKLVKFETLKKYTVIQIICFIISLSTMLLKF
jgi:hypothetical protein